MEGAQRHNYAGQRGYHPLLAVAAGTGDVLMARLRKGRANTARGAAHFLRETVSRVRYAGATGSLTVRADSGFYTHPLVAVCRAKKVRYSITVRQHPSVRNIIEAIPEDDWSPSPTGWKAPPTWRKPPMSPSRGKPDAVPVRLIQTVQLPRRSAPGRSPGVSCRNLHADLAHRRHHGPPTPPDPVGGFRFSRPVPISRVAPLGHALSRAALGTRFTRWPMVTDLREPDSISALTVSSLTCKSAATS